MDALVFKTLRRFVKTGTLTITTANGVTRSFGDGAGPAVAVRFRTAAAQRRVLLDPELRLGEAFVDGDLIIEQGTITELLELLLSQEQNDAAPITTKILPLAFCSPAAGAEKRPSEIQAKRCSSLRSQQQALQTLPR